jgi:hypothetical protein
MRTAGSCAVLSGFEQLIPETGGFSREIAFNLRPCVDEGAPRDGSVLERVDHSRG